MQGLKFGAIISAWGMSAFFVTALMVNGIVSVAVGRDQDMQNMPGMKMPKSQPKANRKVAAKKRKAVIRKRQARKHRVGDMTGMSMPGMKMPHTQIIPGPKPAAASPTPPPSSTHMHMPGMQMPEASPSPQASPQHEMEMGVPKATATPVAAPGKMDPHMPGMHMPAPAANAQTTPEHKMPSPNAPTPHSHAAAGEMEGTTGNVAMDKMNMGPLLVMAGNEMSVRVGESETNLLNMGQMGSGTSWVPASSQMHMWDKLSGDWVFMFHFNALAGVNSQGGPRGRTKFESANWFMPMAFHKLGKGTIQLRGMFSFEPFTFARGGSPLLFQTGETYKGQPLVDRQHPHDLLMELSSQYTLPLGERGTWFTYFGYPGEPALGPPAFMHRESASENPSATLAHHLQDSTHISFGVLTSGFTYRWFKVEGSIFNGREPDENRYNLEAHKWNSRSARFSFAPNKNWTMQVSYGFLRKPEASEPNTDIHRATASIHYNKPITRGNWATSVIWGRNHASGDGESHNLNGYTAESTVNFLDKNYLYTRLELVDKNELLRPADRIRLRIADEHPSFRIGAYTFGGARDIWNNEKFSAAVGSDLTFYSKPAVLDEIYGKTPVSWRLFLRLRPSKMHMGHTNGMASPTHGEHQMPPRP